MAKRESIKPSLRWSVFSRDGFACRYCGAHAGQDGVELVIDHLLSVVEGGDNRFDNLITACSKCNGGKGGRSLKEAPTSAQVVDRIHERLEQLAVNLKCQAYRRKKRVTLAIAEAAHIDKLSKAYGPDQVLEWYSIAARKKVRPRNAIKYVWGIVRKLRDSGKIV